MSKNALLIFALLALALYALSCAAEAAPNDGSAAEAALNPNGDSELALLMRAMYDDAMQMKAAIERGEQPKSTIEHERLLTAAATEPEKAASPEYHAWAQAYLLTLQSVQSGEVALAPELFKNMVDGCMGCHTALCPGPKVRIRHLY